MRNATLLRILVLLALVAALEALCRMGYITNFTMQPPTRIVQDLWKILSNGKLYGAISKTLTNATIAFSLAIVVGITTALLVHSRKLVREALDPLFATYYAIPVLAFYPLLVILFGLGDAPQIIIAFMLGVPRVLLKTARVARMSPRATALKVTLPFAMPYILTGAKFAIAYSLIGIIGSEFIMSRDGMGFEIAFAYTNFDNAVMYPLILLVLLVSITANLALVSWEKRILGRRGQA